MRSGRNIDKLERFQKRPLGMIISFRGKIYKEKIVELGVYCLERLCSQGHLVCISRLYKGALAGSILRSFSSYFQSAATQ